jgi:LPXTG-motif cell wall-anchored protein
MTLTASSNQFSLWAVIIGAPSSPTPPFNPVLYALIGSVAILIIAGLILGTKRRKKSARS